MKHVLIFCLAILGFSDLFSQSVIKQTTNELVTDEYDNCDTLAHLQGDPFYLGPGGEAMNIEPESRLISKYLKLSQDSGEPYMSLILNIDTTGQITEYSLEAFCGSGIIYYNDTIHSALYDQIGKEFWELALKEVKKYPKWKPAYSKGRKVRSLHHMLVVFSRKKVGEDDN